MKPSLPATTNCPSSLSKPTTTSLLPALLYEPTSVLDPHIDSSPDPLLDLPSLPAWDPPPPPPPAPPSLDEWDPLLNSWLTDSAADPFPAIDLDSLFPPPPPPPFDQSHLDQLLRAALALESRDRDLAFLILTRLNHHLPSPSGRPIQRSAFYFKDALHSLLLSGNLTPSTPLDLVRKIAAYKALSDLSPVPQFTSFTANQAVLEHVCFLDPAGSPRPIRLIDFDIGLGGHWSSFMHEIAARFRAAHTPPPPVRITAVVPEESLEAALAAENLRDFAAGLGIRFSIELVRPAALAGVRAWTGESVAVMFTPAAAGLVGAEGFVRFVRRVGARVAVMVDAEPCCTEATGVCGGFRRRFAAGVEWYAAAMEAVEAAAGALGYVEEQVGRIERALVQGRVAASVRGYVEEATPWREVMEGAAGMRPAGMSDFTETQAQCLARGAVVAGYGVVRRDAGLVLSWQGVEMAATYAWSC